MHEGGEWVAVLSIWLTLMTVCGVFVVRIAMLLHQQRRAEHVLRLRIAASVGRAVRESARQPGEPA